MARRPRQVLPGEPHHVVQRGSRKAQVFFQARDYRRYLEILRDQCRRWEVAIWCFLEHRIESWESYLHPAPADREASLREHSRSGAPLGSKSFVARCRAVLEWNAAATED